MALADGSPPSNPRMPSDARTRSSLLVKEPGRNPPSPKRRPALAPLCRPEAPGLRLGRTGAAMRQVLRPRLFPNARNALHV